MDVQTKFNYYDILEVRPQSTHQEVVNAYEKLKVTYSGDNPAIYTIFSQDEAKEMLGLVEEAFNILGNKTLRKQYDEKLVIAQVVTTDEESPALIQSESNRKSNFKKPVFKEDSKLEHEFKNCKSWDGDWLRRVREYKNWSLEDLSALTKISGYYINAIEKMDSGQLPAPVFVRGYVSQLSRVYALDEKTVCDSYMKAFKNKIGNKA